jgi:hypothetical protein
MSDRMETASGYRHGNGMNGAAVLATERRLTLLEVGQTDLTRRVGAVEIAQQAALQADHQRDRMSERLDERLANFLTFFSKDFLERFRRLEAENKRIMLGLAMLGASGAVQGAKWFLAVCAVVLAASVFGPRLGETGRGGVSTVERKAPSIRVDLGERPR